MTIILPRTQALFYHYVTLEPNDSEDLRTKNNNTSSKNECAEPQLDQIEDLAAAGSDQTMKDGSSYFNFFFFFFIFFFYFLLFLIFSIILLNKFKTCTSSFVHTDHVFNYRKSRCD